MFEEAYPSMDYTIVAPIIDQKSGEICYPTRQNYLDGLRQVITESKKVRYFGIYYSGMTFTQSGDWVVLDDQNPSQTASITLRDIF